MPIQNIQHFISNSSWDAGTPIWQVQKEIVYHPLLQQGGVLLLDESADQKASAKTAGAGRQYNGRLGKVEMSQVGTFLSFVHPQHNLWTWVDGELFLPESWFTKDKADERKRLGIPKDRTFATKIELGWKMIQRAKENGLPFESVACDSLYGRKAWFRSEMHQAGLLYMCEVPSSTYVWLTPPQQEQTHKQTVEEIAKDPATVWQTVTVRPTERGRLTQDFAVLRVSTDRDAQAVEWLVIRKRSDGKICYALSNTPADTPLERLTSWKCVRYFVERSIQDAKSDAGWADLRAQKYRAWEHHLALRVLATWFIAQTKLNWRHQYPPDPALATELEVDRLPTLSMANVCTLLRAVLPLPQLTPEEATRQVARHLLNRTLSRKSRMKKDGKFQT
jgi:SRSO17 transposase